jgi:hypothetical protein
MAHDDQPDELPAGDSRDCGHGAYCVQCPPDEQPAPEQPAAADPDKPCYHPEFDVSVQIGRIGENDDNNPTPGMPTAFIAEIVVKCGACDEPFKFDGVPAGLSYDSPATSVDGRELRAPIRPVSLPPRRQRLAPGSLSGYRVEVLRTGDLPFDRRNL